VAELEPVTRQNGMANHVYERLEREPIRPEEEHMKTLRAMLLLLTLSACVPPSTTMAV